MMDQSRENGQRDDRHEREARLQAILDTAVEAIITIDERGRCESMNRAAERMFGFSADEVLGQNICMLMPEPYRSEHDGYLEAYLTTGIRRIIGIGREAIGRHKSGREFPMHLSVSEILLDRGRLFTGIIRDLTEQKQAEQRVIQAERLALLGEATARLAHEARNALQRIQIAIEVARNLETENPPVQHQLDAIERASDALNALLEELRNYAAPLHLERKTTSLVSVWREAWNSLDHHRCKRDVRLIEELPEDPMECRIDRFRLSQVFRNLVENALAACSDPVEFSIFAESSALDGAPAWRVMVRDNGPGLNDEQRARVFEPFYTTKAKGTGLGMAIARRILEAHGGTIAVAANPNGGAAFELIVPVNPPVSK
jgi:two-component system sensor kinase FixL